MVRMVGNGNVIDTVMVEKGIFVINGEVDEPTLVTLYDSSRAVATLILEEGEIRLDGELTDEDGNPSFPTVIGTVSNNAMTLRMELCRSLVERYNRNSTSDKERHLILDTLNRVSVREAMSKNLDNLYGVMMLKTLVESKDFRKDEVDEYIGFFTPEMQKTKLMSTVREAAKR